MLGSIGRYKFAFCEYIIYRVLTAQISHDDEETVLHTDNNLKRMNYVYYRSPEYNDAKHYFLVIF